MIDWTKPIRVKGDHRPAHVVAVTNGDKPGDEPYVLVTINNSWGWTCSEPLRRTLDNRHIGDVGGSGVVLENIPEPDHRYIVLGSRGGGDIHRSKQTYPTDAQAQLELIYEAGILVDAKVLQPNKVPHVR